MAVGDERHALGALPLVTIGQEAGWTPGMVWTFWKLKKNLFPLQGPDPRIAQPDYASAHPEVGGHI